MKLKLQGGLHPCTWRVWLNDQELTHCVRVRIDVSTHDLPEATIVFVPSEIDIDADSMVALQAIVAKRVP